MKKLTVITAMLLLVATSFANHADEISEKVRNAFQKSFNDATEVSWKRQSTIYVASFKVKGQEVSAIYNEEGELVSASRHQTISQLPLRVQVALLDKYNGYRINDDVLESFSNSNGETAYYINLENDKTELKVRGDATGNFTIEDKIKKK